MLGKGPDLNQSDPFFNEKEAIKLRKDFISLFCALIRSHVCFVSVTFYDRKMKTHMSILKEAEDFNDIIIGDFYDTYENLPLKTYLGYQFYNDQCKVSQKYYVMELICLKSLRNISYCT